jgi:hypothetical protein
MHPAKSICSFIFTTQIINKFPDLCYFTPFCRLQSLGNTKRMNLATMSPWADAITNQSVLLLAKPYQTRFSDSNLAGEIDTK